MNKKILTIQSLDLQKFAKKVITEYLNKIGNAPLEQKYVLGVTIKSARQVERKFVRNLKTCIKLGNVLRILNNRQRNFNPLNVDAFQDYIGNTMERMGVEIKKSFYERQKSVEEDLHPIISIIKLSIHWRDNFICNVCDNQFEPGGLLNVDHILPKSKFPCSHPWNLQCLCADCNKQKSDSMLDEIPIFIERSKIRSLKYYNDSQTEHIFNFLNWHYKTESPFGIDTAESIFNSIININRKWADISHFIDKNIEKKN